MLNLEPPPHQLESRGPNFASASKIMTVFAWSVALCWFAASVALWGRYTHDEGYYSIIGREVWKGRVLYADVRCSQMPLLPYFYGGVLQFLPARLESGRAISLFVTLIGLYCAWRLVTARYGARAGMLGLLTVVLSRQFVFDQTQVRTQALTFGLSMSCLYFLSAFDLRLRARSLEPAVEPPNSMQGVRSSTTLICAAGLLAGLSVLARLSLLPLTFAVPFYMTWNARRFCPQNWRAIAIRAFCWSWSVPLAIGLYFWELYI